MIENEIYIPVNFSLPKEDGIYAVKRMIHGMLLKDIVWRKGNTWISMDGKPLVSGNVKAWEYKD